jgi:vancomycin resistance protein YoaR
MSKHKKHRAAVPVLDLHRADEERQAPAPKKRGRIALFVVLGLVIIAGSIVSFERAYSARFYPGTRIGTMPVGGKTLAEVTAHFESEATMLSTTGLRLNLESSGGIKKVTIPIAAQGLAPDKSFEYFSLGDWQSTITRAYAYGREGSIAHRFIEQARALIGKTFAFPSEMYDVAVRSFLSHETDILLTKAVPAQFIVDKKGIVAIAPERIGERMDVDETMAHLKQKIASLDAAGENLRATIDAPLSTKETLAPYLKLAQTFSTKTTLHFHYGTHSWKVTGATFATWLTIHSNGAIGVDDEKLHAFLSKTVALIINDPPEDSRFEMQNGALVEIKAGHPGNAVNIEKTAKKVEQIIPQVQEAFAMTNNFATAFMALESAFDAKTGMIDIPIIADQVAPKITKQTIDQYAIKDVVGSSKTSFKGSSADRITNITVGTATLNGFLIAPGQEFSAVDTIGYVTEEAGYAKEYVIKDNKSIKELGGGLCQIATTLFRMALNAGLPITERAAHRYVVSYYGPGLDATIYGPHPDLRFVNDTGHYLLLQGRVEGTDLIFELYGQKDNRQVSISEPVLSNHIPAPGNKYIPTADLPTGTEQCSETPHAGVTADVTYQVAYPSGEVKEQHFNSVYTPWQRICLEGTR